MTHDPSAALQAHGLTAEQARSLADHMTVLALSTGSELLTKGVHQDTLYLLLSGKLEVLLPFADRSVNLGKIQPGHWIGEVQLIDGGEATVTIRAAEPAALLGLDTAALDRLADSDPDAASALLTSIARDLAARLRRTSTGLIEQTGDAWRLKKPEVRRGWFEQALGWLSGAS